MPPYLADNDQPPPEPLFHSEDNLSVPYYNKELVIAQYFEVKNIALHTAEGNYSVLKREEREVS